MTPLHHVVIPLQITPRSKYIHLFYFIFYWLILNHYFSLDPNQCIKCANKKKKYRLLFNAHIIQLFEGGGVACVQFNRI